MRLEIHQLQIELKQKNNLIESFQLEIRALKQAQCTATQCNGNSTSAESSQPSQPHKALHGGARTASIEKSCQPPPIPRSHHRRKLSLDPPSRSEMEMSSPLPDPTKLTSAPKHVWPSSPSSPSSIFLQATFGNHTHTPKTNGTTESPSNGVGHSPPKKMASPTTSNGESPNDDSSRRVLHKAKGAIKALPRELSIFNSDGDDVTKYSIDDDMPTYELDKTEMRDAYNARGIYTGTVSRAEQMPHGRGRMEYHIQGRCYDGEWVRGHWHGIGCIKNAKGDIYEGEVVNDLREGEGKLMYADGRVFYGHFSQDDPVQGTLVYPDGAKYIGELHNGARHGYGVYYFTDGSKYEGYTVMNVFEGKGKMTWEDGGWYEGEWLQGEIHGYGLEVRADGSLRHKGRWSKGVPIRL